MDYTKKHRESTHSLLMEKWGYGKMDEAIKEAEELEEAPLAAPKNVQALDKRLENLKSIIATIDDPKEVLAALDVVLDKIEALNPDFTDGEKRRTFTQIVKDFREKIKNVGKKDTMPAGSEKDKAEKVVNKIKKIATHPYDMPPGKEGDFNYGNLA